jgi:hypothetical protein
MSSEETTEIKELAKRLAVNAIDTSANTNDINDARQMFFGMNDSIRHENLGRCRNILIIGNGATMSTIKGLKDATNIAKNIHEKVIKDRPGLKRLVNSSIDMVTVSYNHSADFETILSACANVDENQVKSELKKALNYKYIPGLFYEIVGHMLKHRFIDVIINFNFDEILDNIIDEEMHGSEYHFIYSEGNCPDSLEDLKIDGRLKLPIYIKPHGTISHLNSILYTKEQYHRISEKMINLLKELFTGKYHFNDQKPVQYLELNLIIAGFSLSGIDITRVLCDSIEKRILNEVKEKINAYIFTPDVKTYEHNLNSNQILKNKIHFNSDGGDKGGMKIKLIPISTENTNDTCLSKMFLKLWKNVIELYKTNHGQKKASGFRDIRRHELISKLFWDFEQPYRYYTQEEIESDYLNLDKASNSELTDVVNDMHPNVLRNYLVQLHHKIREKLLDQLNADATFRNISKALNDGRILFNDIITFDREKKNWENSNNKFKNYLHDRILVELVLLVKKRRKLLNNVQIDESRAGKYYKLYKKIFDTNSEPDLEYFMAKIGYKKYKDLSSDTYEKSNCSGVFDKDDKVDIDALRTILKLDYAKTKLNDPENNFKELFNPTAGLNDSPVYSVNINFEKYLISPFKDIKAENMLYSEHRWYYHYQKLINDTSWNTLFSVCETGSIFKHDSDIIKKDNKVLCLILSDYLDDEQIDITENKFQGIKLVKDNDKIKKLIWWMHNQHLFLFMNIPKEPNLAGLRNYFVGGIYYESRLLSRNVSPILIDKEKKSDLETLLTIFANYWIRAGKDLRGSENNDSLDKVKTQLLNNAADLLYN